MRHRRGSLLVSIVAGTALLGLARGQPVLASCGVGSCGATLDLADNEYAYHGVPFNSIPLSDATPDAAESVQRHWFFIVQNHGPGDVGSASITADSGRTFSTTPPPPYTASTTAHACPVTATTAGLCGDPADEQLRTSSAQEGADASDTMAPGFTSSRSFSTDVIPAGSSGTTVTLTASFTMDTTVDGMGLLLDYSNNSSMPVSGESWGVASDPPGSSVSAGFQAISVGINSPVVGTAYTVRFSGTIPNSSSQAIVYKPRLQFLSGRGTALPFTDASSFAFCDPVLEGSMSCSEAGGVNVTYTFDDEYSLHPGYNRASIVDYQSGLSNIAGSYPSSGAFVVGDESAAPGSAVTFWGAQWAKLNSPSGGPAPNALKGFEDGGQPTSCGEGVAWSADPGNSGHPPASIPDLMLVIVSSHISQAGSTISGDVEHIVVVQTNPGYASDPGHAGTGTVLGQVC